MCTVATPNYRLNLSVFNGIDNREANIRCMKFVITGRV